MQFHQSGYLTYQQAFGQQAFEGNEPQQQAKPKPLFDELCSARLGKTIEVCKERGAQYGDTLKNGQWLVSRSVIKRLAEKGHDLTTPVAARVIGIAALVDIKYQRFEGGYKEDNLDDGINYSAVLAELMKEF